MSALEAQPRERIGFNAIRPWGSVPPVATAIGGGVLLSTGLTITPNLGYDERVAEALIAANNTTEKAAGPVGYAVLGAAALYLLKDFAAGPSHSSVTARDGYSAEHNTTGDGLWSKTKTALKRGFGPNVMRALLLAGTVSALASASTSFSENTSETVMESTLEIAADNGMPRLYIDSSVVVVEEKNATLMNGSDVAIDAATSALSGFVTAPFGIDIKNTLNDGTVIPGLQIMLPGYEEVTVDDRSPIEQGEEFLIGADVVVATDKTTSSIDIPGRLTTVSNLEISSPDDTVFGMLVDSSDADSVNQALHEAGYGDDMVAITMNQFVRNNMSFWDKYVKPPVATAQLLGILSLGLMTAISKFDVLRRSKHDINSMGMDYGYGRGFVSSMARIEVRSAVREGAILSIPAATGALAVQSALNSMTYGMHARLDAGVVFLSTAALFASSLVSGGLSMLKTLRTDPAQIQREAI